MRDKKLRSSDIYLLVAASTCNRSYRRTILSFIIPTSVSADRGKSKLRIHPVPGVRLATDGISIKVGYGTSNLIKPTSLRG